VAAKCNITKLALEKIATTLWGFSCNKETDLSIVENYIEYLACPKVKLKICHEGEPCTDDGINIVNCNINIVGMSFTIIQDNGISFILDVGDVIGAKLPYIYQWTFDTNVFDLATGTNATSISLFVKLKQGLDMNSIVTPITVHIIDANGCTDTKTCYKVPDGLACSINFVPCKTPHNLVIGIVHTTCKAPHKLDVS
jgi:hypothetical protein